MADRRSIADALALTSEKLDFIHSDKPVSKQSRAKPEENSEEAQTDDSPEPEVGEATDPRQAVRRSRRPKELHPPQTPTLLSDLLVPLTSRLQPATAQALHRAHLERKLANRRATQQEIVEEALHDWLRRHRFLD
jgi:hypothetical protein